MSSGRVALAVAVTACAAGCLGARRLSPIGLQTIVTLGADGDTAGMATDPSVSGRHPGGFRILIPGPNGAPARPLVYDDAGKLLGQLDGGAEADQRFSAPLFARFGPGDSIWVFDGQDRVLVFDAARRFVRAVALPISPWDAVVLDDDRLVVTSANADQPLPLLLLDNQGRVIREIGSGDAIAASVHSPRWIVRGAAGSIWTMPAQFRWRLEHWDTAGAAHAAIERAPAWFPPYVTLLPTTRRTPPQPTIQGAWFDAAGRLWVLGRSAGRHWAAGVGEAAHSADAVVILDPDKAFDSEFEVLDVATARVITSARFERSYTAVVQPGVVVRSVATSAGWRRAELVRVTLDTTQVGRPAARGPGSGRQSVGIAPDGRRGQFHNIAGRSPS